MPPNERIEQTVGFAARSSSAIRWTEWRTAI